MLQTFTKKAGKLKIIILDNWKEDNKKKRIWNEKYELKK